MKKIFLILVLLSVTTSCTKKDIEINDFNISASLSKTCDNLKNEYFTYNDRTYYLACISEINIVYDDQKISLKKAITEEIITLEEILDKAYEIYAMADGESLDYIYDNFIITSCDTLAGNTDIIITISDYSVDYCTNIWEV